MRFFNLMFVHESEQVFRELPYRERHAAPRRPSVPTGVDRVHMVLPGERVDLPPEITGIRPVPVKQDEGFARSLFDVEMLNVH